MTLVCSSITYGHAYYREELALWVTQHCWLRVVHSATRDPHERDEALPSTHRRIDASTRQCSAKFSTEQFPPHAYLCSPPAMVATAAAALNEFGINPERVYSDKYD